MRLDWNLTGTGVGLNTVSIKSHSSPTQVSFKSHSSFIIDFSYFSETLLGVYRDSGSQVGVPRDSCESVTYSIMLALKTKIIDIVTWKTATIIAIEKNKDLSKEGKFDEAVKVIMANVDVINMPSKDLLHVFDFFSLSLTNPTHSYIHFTFDTT